MREDSEGLILQDGGEGGGLHEVFVVAGRGGGVRCVLVGCGGRGPGVCGARLEATSYNQIVFKAQ